jgi:hypothetical protein
VYYGNLMEHGETLSVLGHSFAAQREATFLTAIAVVGILMLLSAGLVFWGNRTVTRTAVSFAVSCSQRTLALTGARPPGDRDPSDTPYPKTVVSRVTGLIGIARGVRPLLGLSNLAVQFAYSLAVILYIDASLTLIVVLLVAPSLFLQYTVNYHAAQNAKRLGAARSRAHRSVVRLLDALALTPRVHPSQKTRVARDYADIRIRELLDRYSFRIMARPYSALISDVFIALAALLIMARLGSRALAGEESWSAFLGYLVFARIFLMSVRGVLGAGTGFARHYPTVRKLCELFSDVPRPEPVDGGAIRLSQRGRDTIGDRKRGRLTRGGVIGVLSPVPITRYNIYAFVDGLVGRRSARNRNLRGSCLCVPNALDAAPGGSLRELLGVPEGAGNEMAAGALRDLGFPDTNLPGSGEGPLDCDAWTALPRRLRAHILLEDAAQAGADLVLVEDTVLAASDAEYRRRWRERLPNSFVLIRYDHAAEVGRHGEKLVMALATDRAVSLLTVGWCRENGDRIQAWLGKHQTECADEDAEDEQWEDEE